MDARPSGGGAEEIFGCNEKVGVPEFLTGTSPGGLGIARTPERTSPIRRPPLDTCGRAGRTPQPGSPAQCCVTVRSGHFLGKVQISFFGFQRSQIERIPFRRVHQFTGGERASRDARRWRSHGSHDRRRGRHRPAHSHRRLRTRVCRPVANDDDLFVCEFGARRAASCAQRFAAKFSKPDLKTRRTFERSNRAKGSHSRHADIVVARGISPTYQTGTIGRRHGSPEPQRSLQGCQG